VGDTLNGELVHTFLVSILDAALLSWIALFWYRRSVAALMRAPGDAAASAHVVPAVGSPDSAQAAGSGLVAWAQPVAMAGTLLPWAWRRLAAAYLTGGLIYSTVIAATRTVEFWPIAPGAIAALLWANLWPIVPVIGLVFVLHWTRTLRVAGLFVLCGSIAVSLVTLAGQILRAEFNSAPLTNIYWAMRQLIQTAYIPAFVLLMISRRRIRTVVAMTLAATLVFGFGLIVFRRLFLEMFAVAGLRRAMLELAAWTSTDVAYYSIYMLLALPAGWVVRHVLRWLAAAYERKAFSDTQLVVDCWFAIVAMEAIAMQLSGAFGLSGIAIGLAAFAGYRGGVELILRVWPPAGQGTAADGFRLLLLRVFGHQARTERVFDYIAQRWRWRGPVQLIAGSDLAMRTVDPGDVFAFVRGRLRDQYVASVAEIPSRVERLDMRPDPDGRFRINELYCRHDTWKATLVSLLAVTDAVVMDLRGFSRESRGCLFELQQIVTTVATNRIVLIVDRATDQPLLEETLALAWIDARPPGRAAVDGRPIALVKVERGSSRELSAVMGLLLENGPVPDRR
jgi:hypothetical protein